MLSGFLGTLGSYRCYLHSHIFQDVRRRGFRVQRSRDVFQLGLRLARRCLLHYKQVPKGKDTVSSTEM